jgi:beta-N-acetylhexosaminidase
MTQRFAALLLAFCFFSLAAASQATDSLVRQIGQMLLIGVRGTAVDTGSALYRDIREGKVGGITVYEANLTPANAAENLRAMIAGYQSAAPTPLFVTITQEGGIVNRLKPKYGFPLMPSAQYLGTINNLDSTKYHSDNIAYTLSRLGINVNFAPVVDIYRADNPVLGSRERTFSGSTEVITRHAEQVIRSHRYFGVFTVLKHFPGHGSSTADSHLGMTDVSSTWSKTELEPYRSLIRKGMVQAVMTAHIVNTQLDATRVPATLSKPVITGMLRKDLKFNGVVFSDDMHMKAVSDEYGLKEAIEKTINAGVDVLLFSGNIPGVTSNGASTLVDLVLELVREGKVSPKRINESYKRILKMKANTGYRSGN